MKKKILFFAFILSYVICNSANAQAARIEKFGVVLNKAESSQEWFLENTTRDSLRVYVVNHQEKVEQLPGGVTMVNSGEHPEVSFIIQPKQKMSLEYIICIHSTGLMIGAKTDSALIPEQFYPKM